MGHEERALARPRALARAGGDRADPAAAAEVRLRAALEAVTALDLEVEALSAALADFARGWERGLGERFAELGAAERLVRRLQRLEDGLLALAARLRSGEPPPRAPRPRARAKVGRSAGRAPWGSADGDDDGDGPADPFARSPAPAPAAEAGDPAPELEAEAVVVKRLFRRLARVLHPDLAQDEPERARLGELMARVNAAYAKGDRTALEVMAERVGAGEPPGELGPEERAAHVARRVATLERIAASLARERERLLRTDTERLRAECEARAADGGDYVAETRAEVGEEAEAAYADALVRLGRLAAAAREVSRARKSAMTKLEKRGPTGARRAFDPLGESDLVRRGAARLDRQRATAPARELARALEDAARASPWDAALTCLAFFAEDAGGRPPDALATAAGWAERWERLRAAWPGAPDLARLLARLPRHLAVGARLEGDEVAAGVQLASAELAAGVRIALERPSFAALAREVLASLGPDEACPGCRATVAARHLHRTRGLDVLHGLVCPGCGAVLRSYWRYGEVDGLEALAPHALRLGLVAEVTASVGATVVGFQMLPAEAEALTADRLRRRFAELYLAPYGVELEPSALAVADGAGPLGPSAHVAGRGPLRLEVEPGAGPRAEELVELLRARIERRFRP